MKKVSARRWTSSEQLEKSLETLVNLADEFTVRKVGGKLEVELVFYEQEEEGRSAELGVQKEFSTAKSAEGLKKRRNPGRPKEEIRKEDGWVVKGKFAYRIKEGYIEAKYGYNYVKLDYDVVRSIYDDLPDEAAVDDLIDASKYGVKLNKAKAYALMRVFTHKLRCNHSSWEPRMADEELDVIGSELWGDG